MNTCVCSWSVAVVRPVDSKGCDEDVDDNYHKNQACGQVFHNVQPPMLLHIIQVPSNCGQNQEMKYNNTQTHTLNECLVKHQQPYSGTQANALYTDLLSTISQYILNSWYREFTYLWSHKSADI